MFFIHLLIFIFKKKCYCLQQAELDICTIDHRHLSKAVKEDKEFDVEADKDNEVSFFFSGFCSNLI